LLRTRLLILLAADIVQAQVDQKFGNPSAIDNLGAPGANNNSEGPPRKRRTATIRNLLYRRPSLRRRVLLEVERRVRGEVEEEPPDEVEQVERVRREVVGVERRWDLCTLSKG
jgi:hypothetical protein